MFKQDLIELKNDGYELIKSVNAKTGENDVKLIQEIQANISGKSCVIIQNQSVNIDVTNNIINMIEKIDDIIKRVENIGCPNEEIFTHFGGAIPDLYKAMFENEIAPKWLGEKIRQGYIKYCLDKCDGSLSEVAKKTNERRSTMRMFLSRMEGRDNAGKKELCTTE